MRTPRSHLLLVAALAIAVASPALPLSGGAVHAEPAGDPPAAAHLDPLPWSDPWSPGLVADASSSPAPWDRGAPWDGGAPWETAAPWLTPAYRSGLLIAIDPATRRPVRPTPDQRRAFSDLLGAEDVAPDLPAERLSRGGEIVHLNGRFQVFSIARRDASGRLILDCASDPAHAATPVASSPDARPTATER